MIDNPCGEGHLLMSLSRHNRSHSLPYGHEILRHIWIRYSAVSTNADALPEKKLLGKSKLANDLKKFTSKHNSADYGQNLGQIPSSLSQTSNVKLISCSDRSMRSVRCNCVARSRTVSSLRQTLRPSFCPCQDQLCQLMQVFSSCMDILM